MAANAAKLKRRLNYPERGAPEAGKITVRKDLVEMASQDSQGVRNEIAVELKGVVSVFSAPCRECRVDYDEESINYIADHKAAFTHAAVCRIGTDGSLRPFDVYSANVQDLSTRGRNKLVFSYGKERVSLFF